MLEEGCKMENENTPNTSGHGDFSEIPSDIQKWNWGAFWLTWIWGIGNRSYIALLSLLPILNIIMPFYLGKYGNELAWRNKYWYTLEDFKLAQKKWSLAGWALTLVILILSISSLFHRYTETKHAQQLHEQVLSILETHPQVKYVLGDDYQVLGDLALITAQTSEGMSPYAGTLFLEAHNQLFSVSLDIESDYTLKKIVFSSFEDAPKENQIHLELYP